MTAAPAWATALFVAQANPGLEVVVAREPGEISDFLNAHGEVRLENVRAFGFDVGKDRAVLEDLYLAWVDDDDYLVMKVLKDEGGAVESLMRVYKARKRGNDVDVARAAKRLHGVEYALEPFGGSAKHACGQLVYLTGTVATGDLEAWESWDAVPLEWSRYLARLRGRFGRVLVLRSWESTGNGYAHVHALLAFLDYVFADLWLSINPKTGETRWRVSNRDRAVLRDWPLGFVDVQAVVGENAVRGRIADVLNYVVKGVLEARGGKEIWNRAALWFMGKRSWGITKELRARTLLYDSIERGDERTPSITQKAPWVRVVFLGMVKRFSTELQASDWFKVYEDPPEWVGAIWVPKRSQASRPAGGLGLGEVFAHGNA